MAEVLVDGGRLRVGVRYSCGIYSQDLYLPPSPLSSNSDDSPFMISSWRDAHPHVERGEKDDL